MTRIWFDTEFIEDGVTIDLISIGMVRDDGATFYAECEECDHSHASEWVKQNVLPHLRGGAVRMPRRLIAESIVKFAGEKPEFWAYYADYDWVALCQLYGTMMDLPKGWPMYCRDLKQLTDEHGNPSLPEQTSSEHHALTDALWTRDAWLHLRATALSGGHAAASTSEPNEHESAVREERERCLADLKAIADRAYCDYINAMRRDECLGADTKLQLGQFTRNNLEAHCAARESFGRHKGIHEALTAFRALPDEPIGGR